MGLVLAGGLSSRMGTDKAMLKLSGGPTLLEQAFRLLNPLTASCFVSCAKGHVYSDFPCLEDQEAKLGPAGGILTGLRKAKQLGLGSLLTIPCDMPFLTSPLLLRLLKEHAKKPREAFATIYRPASGGKLQMLCAAYSTDFLPTLQDGLNSGLTSLFWLLPAEGRHIIFYDASEAKQFANCNTPDDWRALNKI